MRLLKTNLKLWQQLNFFKKAIEFYEDLANDKNQDDIVYLIDRIIYFDNMFSDYVVKNNIDQVSKESIINNSTFIETPEWIKK